MENKTKINAVMQTLVQQRDSAMNMVAELMGEVAELKEKLAEAEAKLPKEEASE